MKKILILGGTQFIGRNLVDQLLNIDAYEITLFNRQLTHTQLFPNVNKIKGDRETYDIKQISKTNWDYVIDLSCYYPEALNNVLFYLNQVEKYIFISTCSVYDNQLNRFQLKDEQSKILSCTESQKTDRSPETYGNRKAECERILQKSGLSYTILRPALVFGKYDHTDRFYYWLYQVNHHQTLLLPDNGARKFSTTYVIDLVEIIIQALRQDNFTGIFNVTTTPKTSIKKIVDQAGELLNKDFNIVNVSADFLKENNITQWTDMPLWIDGDHFTFSNQKLLNHTPLDLTELKKAIGTTINFYNTLGWKIPKYGISEKQRQKLLKKRITKG